MEALPLLSAENTGINGRNGVEIVPKIELHEVTAIYMDPGKDNVVALDELNGEFDSEAFNVVVGYSGCGKSTLMKCIAGIEPYDGDILADGEDLYGIPTEKRNFAFVSQEFSLYPHMTVFDNIALPLKVMGCKREEATARVKKAAQALNLTACLTRKPKHISIGQQQRVAIARAIVKEPKVCLLDEPFSNLDAPARTEIGKELKSLLKSIGCTVVYVTHDFRAAMSLGDKIIVMEDGKVAISGTPAQVYDSGDPVVQTLKSEGTFHW